MNKYQVTIFVGKEGGAENLLQKEVSADRMNVYGKGRVCFMLDHKRTGFWGGIDSEIICEIQTVYDLVVEKI